MPIPNLKHYMADLSFVQFVKNLHQEQVKNFWGEVRARKKNGTLLEICDLTEVSPDQIKDLARETTFSSADLEAGYRALCVATYVRPAWPPRIYP